MLDAGWTVHVGWLVLAVLVGVIIGCLILRFFAGAKEPKCNECVLMYRAVSSGKGTYCSNQMAKCKESKDQTTDNYSN